MKEARGIVKPEHRRCRLYGHVWESVIVQYHDGETYLTDHLRCARCNTARRDRVDLSSGCVTGRGYTYGSDYKLPKGSQFDKEARGALRVQECIAQIRRKKNSEQ